MSANNSEQTDWSARLGSLDNDGRGIEREELRQLAANNKLKADWYCSVFYADKNADGSIPLVAQMSDTVNLEITTDISWALDLGSESAATDSPPVHWRQTPSGQRVFTATKRCRMGRSVTSFIDDVMKEFLESADVKTIKDLWVTSEAGSLDRRRASVFFVNPIMVAGSALLASSQDELSVKDLAQTALIFSRDQRETVSNSGSSGDTRSSVVPSEALPASVESLMPRPVGSSFSFDLDAKLPVTYRTYVATDAKVGDHYVVADLGWVTPTSEQLP